MSMFAAKKCDHDWKIAANQDDTGRYGVRKVCVKCQKINTFYEVGLA